MFSNLIQPGDRVLLSVPTEHILKMNSNPEEFAEVLDGYYPGVSFEVFPTDAKAPSLLFIYRDPDAYAQMRREAEIVAASEKAGVTPDVVKKVREGSPFF